MGLIVTVPQAARCGGNGAYRQFAASCLLARQMVERGVRFVNLYRASRDHHGNLDKELAFNCSIADRSIAALLKGLKTARVA